MSALTSYSPSQLSTVTGGSPDFSGGAGGLGAIGPLIFSLLAKRGQDAHNALLQAGPQGRRQTTLGAATAPARPASPAARSVLSGQDPMQAAAQRSALEAIILRNQAAASPPPQRMTTFASGANNAYMPDVNAMNAYQRQLFLPQDSRQIQDAPEDPGAQRVYFDAAGKPQSGSLGSAGSRLVPGFGARR